MTKLGHISFLAVLMAAGDLLAQEELQSGALRYHTRLAQVLSDKAAQDNASIAAGQHFQISGPLAQPFKPKGFRSLPRRLLHWINPFAPSEHREQMVRSSDYDPRPWSAVAGWNSGGPWFPNEATHEGGLSLISVSPR